MRKFLLVIFIGAALGLSLYGIINDILIKDVEEIDHIEETTVSVYME